jgi:hypothetical protein
MRARFGIVVVTLLLTLLLALAFGRPAPGGAPGRATNPSGLAPAASTPVTASIGGTHLLPANGHAGYFFNATGGPAYAANGSRVGNLTYYANIAAVNTTGVTLNPDQDSIFNGTAPVSTLTVGAVAETLTIHVMFSSIYQGANESVNLTYTVNVVLPYVVSATIEDVSSSDVLSFPVVVSLDGAPVGTVTVATLTPNTPFHLSFSYLTLGLSAGWHTFSISLASQHGLVAFAGGATTFSESIYIPGPAPDYTLWYVVGIVAFVGTIFILVTRVAARRRGANRK